LIICTPSITLFAHVKYWVIFISLILCYLLFFCGGDCSLNSWLQYLQSRHSIAWDMLSTLLLSFYSFCVSVLEMSVHTDFFLNHFMSTDEPIKCILCLGCRFEILFLAFPFEFSLVSIYLLTLPTSYMFQLKPLIY
jgi:hypothetical protein